MRKNWFKIVQDSDYEMICDKTNMKEYNLFCPQQFGSLTLQLPPKSTPSIVCVADG